MPFLPTLVPPGLPPVLTMLKSTRTAEVRHHYFALSSSNFLVAALFTIGATGSLEIKQFTVNEGGSFNVTSAGGAVNLGRHCARALLPFG